MPKKKKRNPKKGLSVPARRSKGWAAVGVDISGTALAGCGVAWDETLGKMKKAVVSEIRLSGMDYLDKLRILGRGDQFVQDLVGQLRIGLDIDDVYIAIEEPFPMTRGKMQSNTLKQQGQYTGAFLGSVLRYGYPNLFEVHNQTWLKPVRADLGIGRPDKWDVKRWAIEYYRLPDLPDLIQHSKLGKIPRPETSKAKAVQPDDIYDACGIMAWLQDLVQEQLEA